MPSHFKCCVLIADLISFKVYWKYYRSIHEHCSWYWWFRSVKDLVEVSFPAWLYLIFCCQKWPIFVYFICSTCASYFCRVFGDIIDCFHISFSGCFFDFGCNIFKPLILAFLLILVYFLVIAIILRQFFFDPLRSFYHLFCFPMFSFLPRVSSSMR